MLQNVILIPCLNQLLEKMRKKSSRMDERLQTKDGHMSQLNPTLITFIFYIVAMIGIGLYAYKATTDFSDYILGGRSLGSVVTALSAGASDMSG